MHTTGVRTHVGPSQRAVSQAFAGAQVAAVHDGYWQPVARSQVPPGIAVQSAFMGVKTHPVGPQESAVHATPSLQAVPATQTPPRHTSPVVQGLPSLQGAALFVRTQPRLGLQASSVQKFPSSQGRGVPTQRPAAVHASPVVQASPSLQLDPLRGR
jgi:hypothetical protein